MGVIFIASVQFFSGQLGLLLAAGRLLAESRLENRLLAGVFAVFGLVQLHSACGPAGLLFHFPVIFRLSYPLPFLFGPLFYLYARRLRDRNFELQKKHLFHFLPFLAACAVMADTYLSDPATKRAAVEAFLVRRELHWPEYLFGAGLLLIFCYVVWITIESRLFFSPRILREERSLRFFVYVILTYFVYFALITPSGILNDKTLYYAASLLSGLSLPVGFLIASRYPDFFDAEVAQAAFEKYRKQLLTPGERIELGSRLEALMREETLYRDPRLTVAEIAARLGITPPALSQLINGRFGKNFNEYLNEHRLREVRERLRTSDDTILAIALAAGFNSKNAFNEAFRKTSGTSPREFRRRPPA